MYYINDMYKGIEINFNIVIRIIFIFFFKQKTAYEIGTGDWSSDVCSSDLAVRYPAHHTKRLGRP